MPVSADNVPVHHRPVVDPGLSSRFGSTACRRVVHVSESCSHSNAALDKFAARAKEIAEITPDRVIREGDTAEEIIKLIDDDADIGILVLAAGTGKEGPGPLVSNLAKTAGTFPIPVALVPGHLSDEEIDASS